MQASIVCLSLATAAAADWSFKDFLAGDWDLERHTPGKKPEFAHYSLEVVGAGLEGTYYEVGEEGKDHEMIVRVVFDDATSGQFQLGKPPTPQAPQSPDELPEPTPEVQPEVPTKTAFEFDFRAQNGGRFHLSESSWQGTKGGTVQFICSDEDSFVFSKATVSCVAPDPAAKKKDPSLEPVCSEKLHSWTASRQGESRRKAASDKPRSLLQRYGWYCFFAMLYFGYQAAKEAAAKAAGGMAGGMAGKKKK